MALARIDADDVSSTDVTDSMGRMQSTKVINESGLYSLVLGSRKPEAKKFKKWVTAEVLPAIRKTGSYSVAPQIPNFADPAEAAIAWAAEYRAKKAAEEQLILAAPKVEFVDKFVSASTGSKGFREICKALGTNEKAFRDFLVARRVMYKLGSEWVAYQPHIDAGRFEVKFGEAGGHAYSRCLFTAKGAEWIAREWGGHQAVKLLK
jgi:phage antirepressor YoqD-like protein